MGLNFKILVIWKALSTMPPKVAISAANVMPSGFGSAGSNAASLAVSQPTTSTVSSATSSAAPVATPVAPTKTANQCSEFRDSGNPCSRRKCWDADCRDAKAKQHTASQKHSAPPKAAGGVDGGISANIAAMEARIKSHIDLRFQSAETSMKTGFLQLSEAVTQSQIATQQSFQGLANAMAAAFSGGQRQLPPSERRQIGNGAQEVVKPRQNSYGQDADWDPVADGSGRFAQSSSQFSHAAGVACGGAAQSFYREPVPTATSRTSTPKFDAAAARWNAKRTPNNERILQAIREAIPDDNMRCLLLALVNGKTLSEITNMYNEDVASLLSICNTSFFQNFFAALSRCGLPPNFDVKVDASKTKTCHGFVMTYTQLSQAPGNVDKLVRILRGE